MYLDSQSGSNMGFSRLVTRLQCGATGHLNYKSEAVATHMTRVASVSPCGDMRSPKLRETQNEMNHIVFTWADM